jgi:hypothetical protein
MHKLYQLKEMLCEELESYGDRDKLSSSSLDTVDKLAHATKNVMKIIEGCEEEKYSERGRSYEGTSNRYPMGGYYYGDEMSNRRGRAANGRFVSRDGSDMARRLREMMDDAPDDNVRNEIQRLADRMENM